MKEEQHRFLTLPGRLPARLTAEQTAWVLGCQPHDVPILVAARLLKPLGHPRPNSVKFFATVEVLESAQERSWLTKITNALNQHWQKKNAAQRRRPPPGRCRAVHELEPKAGQVTGPRPLSPATCAGPSATG
jgi:hypothetical protein